MARASLIFYSSSTRVNLYAWYPGLGRDVRLLADEMGHSGTDQAVI